MPDNRFLILKGCAGLGNRLISLYSAITYCLKTNRTLIVDWRDGQFDVKGEEAFRKCFNIQNLDVEDIEVMEGLNRLKHNSELFRMDNRAGVYDLYYEWHSNFWQQFPDRLFYNPKLKKLRRRWQPIKNGGILNSLNFGSDLSFSLKEDVVYFIDQLPLINYNEMPTYITLKSDISEKITELTQVMGLERCIGIHVRNTDKKPTADVERVVQYLKKSHPKQPLFLSTDSQAIETLFLNNFNKVYVSKKYRPELKSEGLHQWALYNKRDDLKFQLYEESVIDMFLLSKCEHLYFQGNSSFSNTSRVYHQNKLKCYDWLKL